MHLPLNVSESVKKRNPDLFAPVGAVESAERKRCPASALEREPQGKQGCRNGLVLVVSLIACRKRVADDDNLVAGCKPLRDAIARSVGIDDGDKRLRWEYGQIVGTGPEGVIVKIGWAK